MNAEDSTPSKLIAKYQALLLENSVLKEEIRILQAQLALLTPQIPPNKISEFADLTEISSCQSADKIILPGVNSKSDASDKIRLFMSLFKGRDDVYANRWENKRASPAEFMGDHRFG